MPYLTPKEIEKIDRYMKAVGKLYNRMGHPKKIDDFYKSADPTLIRKCKKEALNLLCQAGELIELVAERKGETALLKRLKKIEKDMVEIATYPTINL